MKAEFLEELTSELTALSKRERARFVSYYAEMIEDYLEDGLSEADVFKQIGEPREIAQQILKEQETSFSKNTNSSNKVLTIGLLILGFPLWGSLLVAVAALFFSAYLIIWCVPLTTILLTFGFFVGGLVSIIGLPFMLADIFIIGVIQLGIGLLLLGLAILCGLVTYYSTKKMQAVTKMSLEKMTQIFRKKVIVR
ncbi:DUF1700 domain-containing protein [Enterococcus sp. LJL98]